jgi:hypothetical protein
LKWRTQVWKIFSAWQISAAQRPAHGGGPDPVSEAPQLTVHAAESPSGILGAEASW